MFFQNGHPAQVSLASGRPSRGNPDQVRAEYQNQLGKLALRYKMPASVRLVVDPWSQPPKIDVYERCAGGGEKLCATFTARADEKGLGGLFMRAFNSLRRPSLGEILNHRAQGLFQFARQGVASLVARFAVLH